MVAKKQTPFFPVCKDFRSLARIRKMTIDPLHDILFLVPRQGSVMVAKNLVTATGQTSPVQKTVFRGGLRWSTWLVPRFANVLDLNCPTRVADEHLMYKCKRWCLTTTAFVDNDEEDDERASHAVKRKSYVPCHEASMPHNHVGSSLVSHTQKTVLSWIHLGVMSLPLSRMQFLSALSLSLSYDQK